LKERKKGLRQVARQVAQQARGKTGKQPETKLRDKPEGNLKGKLKES
jgi:hypothetical protein